MMTIDKKRIRFLVLTTLVFLFCAHAFCYANLSFSGASVMVDASRSNSDLISGGQFLASLYLRIRGALSAPMLVGMLSAVYLAIATVLIADMLCLQHPLSLFMLSGALTLPVSVTAINASMLHLGDVYFLALLFFTAGAWLCIRLPLGFVPAVCCFAAGMGLQPSMFAAGPALVLIACTYQALCAKRVRMQLFTIIKFLVSLFIGFLIYAAVAYLFSMRWGAEFSADWQTPMGEDLLSMWLFPIVTLLDTPTAYPLLCALIYLQLLAACWALFLHKAPLPGKVFALLSLLLLPFSLNMPVFAASPVRAVREQYVLCLLPVALISLLDLLCGQLKKKAGGVLRVLFACAFGVTFLSSIVFSNQVYLKKNLEYQTTLSVMTRVVEQAEQTEGFIPGYTPVAIVGSLENSTIAMAHKGFEHLSALDAAANNYTASSQSENTWYFWEIMGYPFNFVSDGQRDALAASDAVQSMPAFPAKGFCSTVDGILVIKLSPSM